MFHIHAWRIGGFFASRQRFFLYYTRHPNDYLCAHCCSFCVFYCGIKRRFVDVLEQNRTDSRTIMELDSCHWSRKSWRIWISALPWIHRELSMLLKWNKVPNKPCVYFIGNTVYSAANIYSFYKRGPAGIRTQISDCIHDCFVWNIITHACPNFNGGLTKLEYG